MPMSVSGFYNSLKSDKEMMKSNDKVGEVPIDHKQLLMKYIAHVGAMEGVTFIHSKGSYAHKTTWITDDEWLELEKLEDESRIFDSPPSGE